MQAWSERLGQQARRRVRQALVLGLHVGEVGLWADVALWVKLVRLEIVVDQVRSWCRRLQDRPRDASLVGNRPVGALVVPGSLVDEEVS